MRGYDWSSVEICGVKTIEIKVDDSGKRRFIFDGKEADLSKIRSLNISLDYMGITIEADIDGGSLPIKE